MDPIVHSQPSNLGTQIVKSASLPCSYSFSCHFVSRDVNPSNESGEENQRILTSNTNIELRHADKRRRDPASSDQIYNIVYVPKQSKIQHQHLCCIEQKTSINSNSKTSPLQNPHKMQRPAKMFQTFILSMLAVGIVAAAPAPLPEVMPGAGMSCRPVTNTYTATAGPMFRDPPVLNTSVNSCSTTATTTCNLGVSASISNGITITKGVSLSLDL